eukprot:1878258-Rhodomonas_salina.1
MGSTVRSKLCMPSTEPKKRPAQRSRTLSSLDSPSTVCVAMQVTDMVACRDQLEGLLQPFMLTEEKVTVLYPEVKEWFSSARGEIHVEGGALGLKVGCPLLCRTCCCATLLCATFASISSIASHVLRDVSGTDPGHAGTRSTTSSSTPGTYAVAMQCPVREDRVLGGRREPLQTRWLSAYACATQSPVLTARMVLPGADTVVVFLPRAVGVVGRCYAIGLCARYASPVLIRYTWVPGEGGPLTYESEVEATFNQGMFPCAGDLVAGDGSFRTIIDKRPPDHIQAPAKSYTSYHHIIYKKPSNHRQATIISYTTYHQIIYKLPPNQMQEATRSSRSYRLCGIMGTQNAIACERRAKARPRSRAIAKGSTTGH